MKAHITTFVRRLRSLGQKAEVKQEIDEELRFHIEQRTADNIAAGMSSEEAAREARKRFGNTQRYREECRDVRGASFGEVTLRDVRFGLRMIWKNPGFTAVAVLSLSLGIAANSTIFSFVSAFLFRPPPVDAPGELWQIQRQSLKAGSPLERYQGLSYPDYAYFRDQNRSFTALAAFDSEPMVFSWNRNGIGQAIQCQFVSGNFFGVCGVNMTMGRPFTAEEDRQPGHAPVAVASYAFWKNTLGGDPEVLGRSMTVNGIQLSIVGVAPAKFTGLRAGMSPDLWVPFANDTEWTTRMDSFELFGLGRLRPGLDPVRAELELTALTRQLEQIDPKRHKDITASVVPLSMLPEPSRGVVRKFTALLMGAVFMVLLIACANAASLMLARAMARRGEMAVRASLGASRGRLMRQILTESVLLGLLSGGLGLLMTKWLVPVLMQLSPPSLEQIRPDVSLDIRVFLFTGLVSVLTGVIFGFAPAWQGTRLNLTLALKDVSRTSVAKRSRLASLLVSGQIAVSLILLIAGALCLRSLYNAQNVPLGFKVQDRVTAELSLKDYTPEQREQFNESFIERVSALPGVESVAIADFLPLDTRELALKFNAEGREPPPGQDGFVLQTLNVGPRYFATMGTTLLHGREFVASDREGTTPVAIVNQLLADKFWPGQNAVGHRLTRGSGDRMEFYEIVGVVETGKYRTLGEDPRPAVFRCHLQEGIRRSTFVTHLGGDSQSAMAAMRQIVQELDPKLFLSRLGSLEQHLALALFPARATGLLFSVFGTLAALLAVSGLFGVIAYSVSQRTREIGVRMALGANRGNVLIMILRQGLKLSGAGILIGLVGAFALTPLMGSLLYGIGATDPLTFAIVPLSLAAAAMLACWLPARRAARVDPMVALRYE